MQLFLKTMTMTGKTFTVEVERSDTIGGMKAKIAEKYNIPPDDQNVISCGKGLEDFRTLAHYGIGGRQSETLHLIITVAQPAEAPPEFAELEKRISRLAEHPMLKPTRTVSPTEREVRCNPYTTPVAYGQCR